MATGPRLSMDPHGRQELEWIIPRAFSSPHSAGKSIWLHQRYPLGILLLGRNQYAYKIVASLGSPL